ncbi:adenylate/guanylate cyclase domain-containing protein [Leptospira yasudae]|uniref:adenylate/guanylate cyclase domain-containing protein n=1 Tax=Leptospira yasudae TaxID=2202201 RepID=UPI001082F426|nr:adenylate/guanylate cyclase domain-containing protein [Leptospira yasudae]TGK29973.1 adenylate/guanylate cyclase domain-containing protein [Leptospira yasudae]TGM07401.1 adenylate/guanylate cyclase domain-containing protein [Leptospira yasudae]
MNSATESIKDTLELIRPYLPSAIVRRLGDSNESKLQRSQSFEGAVLFFDVVGFTPTTLALAAKGTRGIDALQTVLSNYYTALLKHLNQWGGAVYQFAGDSVLVSFEKKADETDAEAALRVANCALGIFHSISEFSSNELLGETVNLPARVGLAYGEYQEFILGEQDRFLRAVIAGTPVDQSISAEKHALAGDIVLSSSIWDLLPASKTGEALGENFYRLTDCERVENTHVPPSRSTADDRISTERFFKRCKRFIVPELYQRVTNVHSAFSGDYREVASVFVRIDAPLESNTDSRNFNDFFTYVQGVAAACSGTFVLTDLSDKGGIFSILFGAPAALENKEALAARFAIRLMEGASSYSAAKNIQIGISTGMAYCGDLGAPFRKDFTAIGEMMNIAARLATLNGQDGILIDSQTKNKLGKNFVFHEIGDVELKGVSGSKKVFQLTSEQKNIPGLLIQYRDTMIGRKEEIDRLHKMLDASIDKGGVVCRIIADAGLGKSRLTNTFIDQAYDRNVEILIGYCYPYEKFTPFYPWKELLSLFLGIFEDDSVEARVSKAEKALENLNAFDIAWAKALVALMGVPVEEDPLTREIDRKQKNERLFEIIISLLQERALKKPLMLIFEDVHWIDELSSRLLEKLASRLPSMKAMLILVSRPEGQFAEEAVSPNEELIRLKEFKPEEAKDFLIHKFHMDTSQEEFLDQILNRSSGNPFFLESIVHNLIEEGTLKKLEDGTLSPSDKTRDIQIPNTLNDVLLARVDRLAEREKIVLKTASVIGRLINVETLNHLLPVEFRSEIQNILQSLEGLDLTPLEITDPLTYIFKHIVIRDIVYNTLLHSTREDLHKRIASFIEKENESNVIEMADILAFHYRQCSDFEKASRYSLMAARKARSRYANRDAIYHYGQALESMSQFTKVNGETYYEIKQELAHVHRQLGEYAQAESLFKECLENKSTLNLIRTYTGLGQVYQEQDDIPRAMETLEKALRITGIRPPGSRPDTIFKIVLQLPFVLRFSIFGSSYTSAGKAERLRLRCLILVILAKMYIMKDIKKFGWSVFTQYNATQRFDDPVRQSLAECALGQVFVGMNLFGPSKHFLIKGRELAEKTGDPYAKAISLLVQGLYYMMLNRPDQGLPYLHDSIAIYRQVGEKWDLLSALSSGGFLYYFQSDFRTAKKYFDDIGEIAADLGAQLQLRWTRIWSPYFGYLLGEVDPLELEKRLLVEVERAALENDVMNELSTINKLLKLAILEGWPEKAAHWSKRSYAGFLKCEVKFPQLQIGNVYLAEAALYAQRETGDKSLNKIISYGLKNGLKLGKSLPYLYGPALMLKGKLKFYAGDVKKAEAIFKEAESFLSNTLNQWEYATALYEAGTLLKDQDRILTAKKILEKLEAKADLKKLAESLG